MISPSFTRENIDPDAHYDGLYAVALTIDGIYLTLYAQEPIEGNARCLDSEGNQLDYLVIGYDPMFPVSPQLIMTTEDWWADTELDMYFSDLNNNSRDNYIKNRNNNSTDEGSNQ